MTRTAENVGFPEHDQSWPPAGKIRGRCYLAEKWTSPKKRTAAVRLWFYANDGEYDFADPVYVTGKNINRLNLVAQHLCAMPKTTPLPDDDGEAARFLARYIMDNAKNKEAIVTIEVETQEFMYTEGPKMGQKGTSNRPRVAYGGYEVVATATPQGQPQEGDGFDPGDVESIPF